MSLTEDQITPGATYTVHFEYGQLSAKRFKDAVDYVKSAGGEYDVATKTWTVVIGEAGDEVTVRCTSCKDGGRDGAYAFRRDEDGLCHKCHGTQEITYRPDPPNIGQLRTTVRYHAIVERI